MMPIELTTSQLRHPACIPRQADLGLVHRRKPKDRIKAAMCPTLTISLDTGLASQGMEKGVTDYESDFSESSIDLTTPVDSTFSLAGISTTQVPDTVQEAYKALHSSYRQHYVDPMQAIRKSSTWKERAFDVLRTRSWPKDSQEDLTSLRTIRSELQKMIQGHKEMCEAWAEEVPPASADADFYHEKCPFKRKLVRSLAKTERRIITLDDAYVDSNRNSSS